MNDKWKIARSRIERLERDIIKPILGIKRVAGLAVNQTKGPLSDAGRCKPGTSRLDNDKDTKTRSRSRESRIGVTPIVIQVKILHGLSAGSAGLSTTLAEGADKPRDQRRTCRTTSKSLVLVEARTLVQLDVSSHKGRSPAANATICVHTSFYVNLPHPKRQQSCLLLSL